MSAVPLNMATSDGEKVLPDEDPRQSVETAAHREEVTMVSDQRAAIQRAAVVAHQLEEQPCKKAL